MKFLIKLKKVIAVCTAFILLFTITFSDFAYANMTPVSAASVFHTDNFISPSLGKITSAKYYGGDEIIINIQDLHCHAETQRKISSIIEQIDIKYKLNNVYLEGTYDKVDTLWLSKFNDGKAGTKVLENLIDSGRLSGTEFYSVVNNKNNFILPIEDETVYKENMSMLGEIIAQSSEIDSVCNEMETELLSVKKEYSNKRTKRLDSLIKNFRNKKITTDNYYKELNKLVSAEKIDLSRYPNLCAYMEIAVTNAEINEVELISEIRTFMTELKSKISYQDYVELLKKSGNLNRIEDISEELIVFDKKYEISNKINLLNFKKFLKYLEFGKKINPVAFLKEEEDIIEVLFTKFGRTKYEKEVNWLSEFLPKIRQYFTANISADEYYSFEKNFSKFRITWPSYFKTETVKKLDKYRSLLNLYHSNNLKRDNIFAKKLIKTKNINSKIEITDTGAATKEIIKNLNGNKIKLVVTGGFHTRGLEKIFEREKVSYMILTPKITQSVEQAKKIYSDTVVYYSQILKNTINIEPLEQEPLNISFPKVLAGIFSVVQSGKFSVYSEKNLQESVNVFIADILKNLSENGTGSIEIINFNLASSLSDKNIKFSVRYKDNSNKGMEESTVNYIYSEGEVVPFADIDKNKVLKMLHKIKNKYAAPTIEIEPSENTRRKIAKYIINPIAEISEGKFSFMIPSQLHMTVGFDASLLNASEKEIDLINTEDSDETKKIFYVTDLLGNEPVAGEKAFMTGTLKLMPDGVIIYQINDSDLTRIVGDLRYKLKSIDSKYGTPAIIHMTIGRISDASLLDGSSQSEEHLAELLAKINERIYQINKQNELSKIKTSFTVKGGFVSSTGGTDFRVKRVVPRNKSLVIFKNLFNKSSTKISNVYKTIVAPVAEEFVFRYLPFSLTLFFLPGTSVIIPVLITFFVGSLLFPIVHTVTDKLISQNFIRDWKSLLPQSVIITSMFSVVVLLIPQAPAVAFLVAVALHSLNNIISIKSLFEIPLLAVAENSFENADDKSDAGQENFKQEDIDEIIRYIENLTNDSNMEECKKIAKNLSMLPADEKERYKIITEQLNIFLKLTINLFKYSFSGDNEPPAFLLIPFMPYIITKGKIMFDYVIDYLFEKAYSQKYSNESSYLMKMIPEAYRMLGFDKAVEIYKKLIEKKIINTEDNRLNFSYTSSMQHRGFSHYEQMKIHYFAVSEFNSSVKAENLADFIEKLLSYFKSQDIPLVYKEKVIQYFNEIEQLKDKITTDLLPLLQYQFVEIILVLSKDIKENSDNKDLKDFYFTILSVFKDLAEISNGEFKEFEEFNGRNASRLGSCCSSIADVAVDAYNRNDIETYKKIMSEMENMAKKYSDYDKFYNEICNAIAEVALKIYQPVLHGNISEESSVTEIYSEVFKIFKELLSVCKNNESKEKVSNFMFAGIDNKNLKGLGLSEQTFLVFTSSFSFSDGLKISIAIDDKTDIVYSEQLIKMIVSSGNNVDIYQLISKLHKLSQKNGDKSHSELYERIAREIILETIKTIESEDTDLKIKKVLFEIFINICSDDLLFEYDDLIDLDKIRELCREYAGNVNILPADIMYAERRSFFTEKSTSKNEYAYTPLLKKLNPELLGRAKIIPEFPLIYETYGKTSKDIETISVIREKFLTLQKILNLNNIVLNQLMLLPTSKKQAEDLHKLISNLDNMIKALGDIDSEYGRKAEEALKKIDSSLGRNPSSENINSQMQISKWNEEEIQNIAEIHTLINAVHQLSIKCFKQFILESTVDNKNGAADDSVRTITASCGDNRIKLYDLSTKNLSKDIIDFIGRLTKKNLPYPRAVKESRYKINDFIGMNDILVWTTRLFVHSVDIFMDFSDENRGISIYYHESGRKRGNVERIKYFTAVLKKLGFKVESDTRESNDEKDGVCSMNAFINKDTGLSDATDIVDIAVKVIDLFKHSDMVDWDLDNQSNIYSESSYRAIFNNFVKKFFDGFIWYKFSPNPQSAYGSGGEYISLTPEREEIDVDVDSILESLGLDNNFTGRTRKVTQDELDMNFNSIIERAYAVGRVILDENGYLVKNENYDIIEYISSAILKNEAEAFNLSRIINLTGTNKFSFRSVGYVGTLVAASGMYKLKDGNMLAVKVLITPETGRVKYSVAEYVSYSGRREIFTDELTNILIEEGFNIPFSQKVPVSEREKERIRALLHRQVKVIDSPEIRAAGTSDGNSTYAAGNIIFNKDMINGESILMVPYTTPDDIDKIKTAKGVITTGGGILSHAAISTRELNKPSAIINGALWRDGLAVVTWYKNFGEAKTTNGLFARNLAYETSVLKEGTRVLMNGETGHILFFGDIDIGLLDSLQQVLNFDNAEKIKEIFTANVNNKDIRRLVEYVYFQAVGNSNAEEILSVLLETEDWPDVIKNKIKELNEGYIQDKITNIEEGINNFNGINNINMRYEILRRLKDKISFIKYFGQRDDIDKLKRQLYEQEKEIKKGMAVYIADLIRKINEYLEKDLNDWTDENREQIMNIISLSDVYNMFVPESEEDIKLIALREVIKTRVYLLRKKVDKYVAEQKTSQQFDYSGEVLGLKDIYAMDVFKFGSKTTELAKIYRTIQSSENNVGATVPNGVGISFNMFEMFFDLINRKEEYLTLKNKFETSVLAGDVVSAKEVAEQISALINIEPFKREQAAITASLADFAKFEDKVRTVVGITLRRDIMYSVRSSGIGEDGASNAFAGMGETFLNVTNDDIMDRLADCWRSFYTDRAVEYMVSSKQIVRPAVLIQEMISVDESCVIFTRDKYGNAVINALYGLGEGIVSGQLTPDRITVDMNTGETIEYAVATKNFEMVPDINAGGGITTRKVENGAKSRTFDTETIKKFRDIAVLLESDTGYKLDIEAGIKDGHIYVFQRRPITKPDKTNNNIQIAASGDKTENMSLCFADILSGGYEELVNLQNPADPESSVTIYIRINDSGVPEFAIDKTYRESFNILQISDILVKRINTDPVVIDKINEKLSVLSRVKEGDVRLLAVIEDGIAASILNGDVVDTDLNKIRNILASA